MRCFSLQQQLHIGNIVNKFQSCNVLGASGYRMLDALAQTDTNRMGHAELRCLLGYEAFAQHHFYR